MIIRILFIRECINGYKILNRSNPGWNNFYKRIILVLIKVKYNELIWCVNVIVEIFYEILDIKTEKYEIILWILITIIT